MSAQRNPLSYFRSIQLAPAIGDWTTIQYRQDEPEFSIQSVQNIGFNSLPRERIESAHFLHYRFAETLCAKLSHDLDIKVDLHTISALQLSYGEYLSTCEQKSVYSNWQLPNFGSVSLSLDWDFSDAVIQRLTGGNADPSGCETFSTIDHTILLAQLNDVASIFSKSWHAIFTIDPTTSTISSGPNVRDPKLALREAVTIFSLTFQLDYALTHRVKFIYSSAVLRRLLDAYSSIPSKLRPKVFLLPKTLQKIKTPVKVTLGQTILTMKELHELQVGDIIPLDSLITSPLDLSIGNSVLLQAQGGVTIQNLCAQIIQLDATDDTALLPPLSRDLDHDSQPDVLSSTIDPPITHVSPLYQEENAVDISPETSQVDDEMDDTLETEEADEWNASYAIPEKSSQQYASYGDNDEDENDDEDDEATALEEDNNPEAMIPPVWAPGSTTQDNDDDLSWDSLDDHF